MSKTGVVPCTIEVDSAGDSRPADYTRLTDVGLRTHLEAEHGPFIAQGTKGIARAEAGGAARVYVAPGEGAESPPGYRAPGGPLASPSRKPLPEVSAVTRD